MGGVFSVYPSRDKADGIARKMALDMFPAFKEMVSFLFAVDTVETALPEGLYDESLLREAVRRYETLWLPLLIEQERRGGSMRDLVPPIDVAWVWFVHRLAPQAYQRDMQAVFGRVPAPSGQRSPRAPPALPRIGMSNTNFDGAVQRTEDLWREAFPSEPFSSAALFAQPDSSLLPAVSQNWTSRFSHDIVGAARRQRSIIASIFTPFILRNIKYSVIRYARFLILCREALKPGRAAAPFSPVPLRDITLAWYCHAACVAEYDKAIKKLKFPLGQGPSPFDLVPEGIDREGRDFLATRREYHRIFWTPYMVHPQVSFSPKRSGPRALELAEAGPDGVHPPPPWPVRPYPQSYGLSRVRTPEARPYDRAVPRYSTAGHPFWEPESAASPSSSSPSTPSTAATTPRPPRLIRTVIIQRPSKSQLYGPKVVDAAGGVYRIGTPSDWTWNAYHKDPITAAGSFVQYRGPGGGFDGGFYWGGGGPLGFNYYGPRGLPSCDRNVHARAVDGTDCGGGKGRHDSYVTGRHEVANGLGKVGHGASESGASDAAAGIVLEAQVEGLLFGKGHRGEGPGAMHVMSVAEALLLVEQQAQVKARRSYFSSATGSHASAFAFAK